MSAQCPIADTDQFIITGFQLRKLQEYPDLDFLCQAILSKPVKNDVIASVVLRNLQEWRMRRMNGVLKKDVFIIWNEETDKIADNIGRLPHAF